MENNLNKGNYNVALEYIKNQFKNENPYKMSKQSESIYDFKTSTFNIKFMNQDLKVKHPSGEIYYENLSRFNDISVEILILRFLVNSRGIPETKNYITYKDIDGGYVYYPNFQTRTINKFIETYGSNIEKFKKTMDKFEFEKLNFGDCSYKVRFINNIYIVFVLWEGDEEIGSSGNILFDSNINHYFDAEDLAVIPDVMLMRL